VTVLVGPNNSGKSLALREIESWAQGSADTRVVVDEIDVASGSRDEVEELIERFVTPPPPGNPVPPNSTYIRTFRPDGSTGEGWVSWDALQNQASLRPITEYIRQTLVRHFVARLDGRTRFALMDDRSWPDMQQPPQHHLAALFVDEAARRTVREVVEAAFPGRYFVIDPTGMGQLRVRLSDRAPSDSAEERGWDDRACAFHAAAAPMSEMSDGVVCFCGLISAAVSLPHRILLLDEPEAFLHPPLARQLGAALASLTAERGASLVTATHSAEFLMGCLESGVDATIVRLTYENGVGNAKVLPPAGIRDVIGDPLLRSTNALAGLFHRGVVVGESDHDRAFYNEINRRLVAVDRGSADTFFSNAQNWQTIARVVGPLRKLGIPAAGILDLDVLEGQAAEWRKFYDAACVGSDERQRLENMRRETAAALSELGKSNYKKHGLSQLDEGCQTAAQTLLADLAGLGLFVVPVGELECWLADLNVAGGSKARWIVNIFDAMGARGSESEYVHPESGDVWAFVDRIGGWVSDPDRRGMEPDAPTAEPAVVTSL
jgi:ABC-type cobalamin/Fe3+-siderophores transport system ATPase subunit